MCTELEISSVCGECYNILVFGRSCPKHKVGVPILWLF